MEKLSDQECRGR